MLWHTSPDPQRFAACGRVAMPTSGCPILLGDAQGRNQETDGWSS
jgi:hypothetical protein